MAQRCGGQIRVSPAGGVTGFDMVAVLAMARAMGINEAAVAEYMPVIEAVMVKKIAEAQKNVE